MNKPKYVRRDKSVVTKWINISNVFAKSLMDEKSALKKYNELDASKRIEIRKQFKQYDEIRRVHYPETLDKSLQNDVYVTSVMVDAHIIATEHDIDPLVAVMCVNPVCGANERVMCIGY